MNLKRFEILLPLNYNDGRLIEREKFVLTHRELVRQFGATTVDTTRASGTWVYGGTLYEDLLVRVTVDSSQPDEVKGFLHQYKEVLKARFEQVGHLDHGSRRRSDLVVPHGSRSRPFPRLRGGQA